MERRAPVPGGQVRHRDAVPAPRVRGVRAQGPADGRCVPRPEGFDTTINPAIVAEFAHVGLSLRPLDADRDGRPARSQLRLERDRPDRGLPQSAGVRRERRPDRRGGGRRHRARHDAPGRQRDRRVHDRGAAQQPARPAARPRRHQHGPRPRHRHAVAQRGAPRILRHDERQPAQALHELGRTSRSI